MWFLEKLLPIRARSVSGKRTSTWNTIDEKIPKSIPSEDIRPSNFLQFDSQFECSKAHSENFRLKFNFDASSHYSGDTVSILIGWSDSGLGNWINWIDERECKTDQFQITFKLAIDRQLSIHLKVNWEQETTNDLLATLSSSDFLCVILELNFKLSFFCNSKIALAKKLISR